MAGIYGFFTLGGARTQRCAARPTGVNSQPVDHDHLRHTGVCTYCISYNKDISQSVVTGPYIRLSGTLLRGFTAYGRP